MGLSLPELQQAARTVTVDTRGVKLDAAGEAQNSRLRMTVVDADGTRREGFFTREKRVNLLADYRAALEKAKGLCGDSKAARDALQGFLKTYGEKNKNNRGDERRFNGNNKLDLDPSLSEENALAHLCYLMGDAYQKGSARQILANAGLNVGQIPQAAIDAMDEGFAASKKNIGDRLSVKELKLQEGARLDDRNASMSAVADLLGVPKLLAKSTPMRCVDQDGTVVEGTFMDYADGEDLNSGPEKFVKTVDDATALFATEGSHFVKDVLDMQVLDYLCGNVDRHMGNMAYQLNEKGQIVGLQGFDNDSAFGLFKGEKDGRLRMRGLEEMRVMSKSMYERIQNTSPEMLKLSLRGTGRSSEEIQFACERLRDLKNLIAEKKPTVWAKDSFQATRMATGFHVVDDADLSKMNPKALTMFLRDSLGAEVVRELTDQHKAAKAMGQKYKRAYYEANRAKFDKRPRMPELGTNERKFTAGGLGDTLQEASALYKNEATGRFIENDTGYWRRSSGAFRDMVRAAAGASKLQKDLTARLSRSEDKQKLLLDNPEIAKEKQKANDAMNRLGTQVEKYLERKRRQRGGESDEQLVINAKNDYERERIRYALELKKAVKNYRDLDNPDVQKQTHEKETAQAVVETAKNREAANKEQANQQAAAPKGPAAQN